MVANVEGHLQFTDETGTWCYKGCPKPEAECGQLAVQQNDPLDAPHCSTCICGRRAPVQGDHGKNPRAPGTVTWAEHQEAYTAYAARYGTGQSAQRLAERGGFGYQEMTGLLGHEPTTWVAKGDR